MKLRMGLLASELPSHRFNHSAVESHLKTH